MYDFLKQSKL